MDVEKLEETARELVAPGKGILAADESFGTIGKRFEALGIESSEDSRRAYRELLFTTEGIGEFLSGVILFDETIRQEASDGTPMPRVLENAGVIPGIKVDKSTVDLPLSPGEKFTQGLDGLGERLAEYRELGARFTKWRAVITIGEGIPTYSCIDANAEALALYAAFAQEYDLVPIVEPEVLIDGDHSIQQCYEATDWMLHKTFDEIHDHGVELSGLLLRNVPAAVPGIVFLSGGQTDLQATAHLNAMNSMYEGLPWELSFSYARALQGQPMEIWGGNIDNAEAAQKAFHHRGKMNSAARDGDYSQEMEDQAA
jgi:fructose-bisphosphate aldolase class I